ncbi:hypothetical protein, partial [Alistipes finegoldii]|uniref:hypothetical protein n=1 Tax=Alistipes finegoldii TaxID=214856 RepID=UPI003FD7A817
RNLRGQGGSAAAASLRPFYSLRRQKSKLFHAIITSDRQRVMNLCGFLFSKNPRKHLPIKKITLSLHSQ